MSHAGGRIRTLRAEAGMTLDQLAEKSGLSKGLLSKLENLPDSNPSLETLQSIADAFDVTVGDLIDSGEVRARQVIPSQKPSWVDSIVAELTKEGRTVDEDILQALYVLQARKSPGKKSDLAWLHMYRSLELNFKKHRS